MNRSLVARIVGCVVWGGDVGRCYKAFTVHDLLIVTYNIN